MRIRLLELKMREVINVCTGLRVGYVDDVIINIDSGQILALVVPGRCRFFGLFGREDDYVIPWECIKKIGDDIILVEISGSYKREKRVRRFWI